MNKYLKLSKYKNWEYVTRINCKGGVIVACYNKILNKYILVEQFRPPINKKIIEFPGGLIKKDESPEDTCLRELIEEVGIYVNKKDLINLGYVYSAVGLTDEKIYIFGLIVDDKTTIKKFSPNASEISNNLKIVLLSENELFRLEAAKVLTAWARLKKKLEDPNYFFM
jgi:ADP-ribose pyrophosphatase